MAFCMLVPTSKSNTIFPEPRWMLEVTLITPGVFFTTLSMGSTITDSISTGAAFRQPMVIVIWGYSISGINCNGSLNRLIAPNIITSTVNTTTTDGFLRAGRVKFIKILPWFVWLYQQWIAAKR